VNRFLASLLLAVFSFSLISPALLADEDPNLPACCRRAGLHHCSLTAHKAGSTLDNNAAGIDTARCAQFPGTRAVPAHNKLSGAVNQSQVFFAALVNHPAAQAQTEALYRISHSRAGQKRGPPTLFA